MSEEFFEHTTASVESLIPYALNAKQHPEAQIASIAANIREFGFTNPILIDEDSNLIAGHGRVLAARKLGMERLPAIVVTGLDDRRRRALIIADNKLAESGWDMEMLIAELADLGDEFGELMGFTEDEIAAMLVEEVEGITDDDAMPELPVDPVTVEGDIWILGRHRLMCGDSTSTDAVEKLMSGEVADMVWTDPPYNVAYEGGTGMTIQNDDMDDDKFFQFLRDAFLAAFVVTKQGGPIYIAHADSEGLNFRTAMIEAGWDHKQTLIWVKNALVMGRQDYQWQHEPILYGWKPGAAHCWYGLRNKTTVIDDDVDLNGLTKNELMKVVQGFQNAKNTTVTRENKPHKNDIHPTMKPVALVQGAIDNSSNPNDRVLDLFGGGGSTLIACEKINRIAYLMELDPRYCDAVITRWEEFTGKKATLENTGEPYAKAG